MKRSNLSLVLSLFLVFGSGAVVGALGHRYYMASAVKAAPPAPKSPEDYRKAYTDEMRQRLTLSQAQTERLSEILDETRDKFRALREKHRPETKAIQDEQVANINAMLTPTQQKEYAKMRAEREAKRQAEAKERESKPTPQAK